jgi:type II secretory pathway component PulM
MPSLRDWRPGLASVLDRLTISFLNPTCREQRLILLRGQLLLSASFYFLDIASLC